MTQPRGVGRRERCLRSCKLCSAQKERGASASSGAVRVPADFCTFSGGERVGGGVGERERGRGSGGTSGFPGAGMAWPLRCDVMRCGLAHGSPVGFGERLGGGLVWHCAHAMLPRPPCAAGEGECGGCGATGREWRARCRAVGLLSRLLAPRAFAHFRPRRRLPACTHSLGGRPVAAGG